MADRCDNEQDRDMIVHAVSDLESMADALAELRQEGKVCRSILFLVQ